MILKITCLSICHAVVSLPIVWSLYLWQSSHHKKLMLFKMGVTRYRVDCFLLTFGATSISLSKWDLFVSILFQRAREIYLKNWDFQRQRLPDSRFNIFCFLKLKWYLHIWFRIWRAHYVTWSCFAFTAMLIK